MDKEQYLKIRGEEEIPLSLFYEYFIEKGGKASMREFEESFPQAVVNVMIPNSLGQTRFMDFEAIVHKVYKYFNEKFGV